MYFIFQINIFCEIVVPKLRSFWFNENKNQKLSNFDRIVFTLIICYKGIICFDFEKYNSTEHLPVVHHRGRKH